jgi:electron transfer flavoprotein beta subunit
VKIVVLLRRLRARPDASVAATQLVGVCDEAALAAGLALRAASAKKATLTVLAAGSAASEEPVLRWALAAGADKAARVDDAALATVDYWGLSRVLAGAIKHLGAELVLTGDRSEDEVQGAVGPAVAEALGFPHLTSAHELSLGQGAAQLARREAGFLRTLELKLPAVIGVASHAVAGLPPHSAQDTSKPIQSIDLGQVGLSAAELKHRDRCLGRAHPVRVVRNATLVRDADDLVARLRDDHLLG